MELLGIVNASCCNRYQQHLGHLNATTNRRIVSLKQSSDKFCVAQVLTIRILEPFTGTSDPYIQPNDSNGASLSKIHVPTIHAI